MSTDAKPNRFLGAKVSKVTNFVNQKIDINKLTVSQVLVVQEKASKLTEQADDAANLELLIFVIKEGAPDLRDLPDEAFNEFPLDELTKLSTEIMQYSGLSTGK